MTHTPTYLCIYLVFRISQHVSWNISETFIYPTSISKKERFRSHNVDIFKHLMYIRHRSFTARRTACENTHICLLLYRQASWPLYINALQRHFPTYMITILLKRQGYQKLKKRVINLVFHWLSLNLAAFCMHCKLCKYRLK